MITAVIVHRVAPPMLVGFAVVAAARQQYAVAFAASVGAWVLWEAR